jgi:uncharacterized membrane protein
MDENKRLLIWLNIAVVILAWIFAINSYGSLPDRIPLHFSWDGQPDRWGDKSPLNFFLLPALSMVIVFLMIFLTRFPKLYNFPQKEIVNKWPEDKGKPVYELLNKMMFTIALMIGLMFLYIQYMIVETAKTQRGDPSQFWPILVIVAALLILPIYYLVKIGKLVKEIQKTIH